MFTGNCPIPLGSYAKDRVNGFEGLVSGKFYYQSGCCGIWIESLTELKDGKPLGRNVNSKRVQIIDFDEVHPKIFDEVNVEECVHDLGSKVIDERTGIQGIVAVIAFYPEDVPHIEILPRYNEKEGKQPESSNSPAFMVRSLEAPTPPPHKPHGTSGLVPRSWD